METRDNLKTRNDLETVARDMPSWGRILIAWGLLVLCFWLWNTVDFPEWGNDIMGAILLSLSMTMILWFLYGTQRLKQFFARMKKGNNLRLLLLFILLWITPIVLMLIARLLGLLETGVSDRGANMTLLQVLLPEVSTAVQMIGEEVLVALITFPLWGWFLKKEGTKRRSFLLATLIGSLVFGALHLPTYHGNLIACFVVIPLARIPLSYMWRAKDSLWAGIILHAVYDILLVVLEYLEYSGLIG